MMSSTVFLPPCTAEVSLYQSRGHYRSAWSAGRTSGIVPQTARNIYVSQTACQIAGWWGTVVGSWRVYSCIPRYFSGDPDPWYQLYTIP